MLAMRLLAVLISYLQASRSSPANDSLGVSCAGDAFVPEDKQRVILGIYHVCIGCVGVHVCVCTCVCKRERDRERDRKNLCVCLSVCLCMYVLAMWLLQETRCAWF